MTIQVLVATMHQPKGDYSLLEKMNIQSDAIVCNQCDRNEFEEFTWNGHNIKWLSFAERGVGLNRNNALMRATADICLFADDDMVYEDNYAEIIRKRFDDNPTANVIAFNLKEKIPKRRIITQKTNVGYLNYLRYGTARIAVRLSSVKKHGIYFNQCFGGGTEHCHGEDNLFLNACLKKGLKLIALPDYVAELTDERASTWNNGYDNRYLHDQGVLYRTLSSKWWRLLCLQDAIRRCKSYKMSWLKAYKIMITGGIRRK
ncbi:MAG: glycosyltransferase family 2 protein [Oscillospiraceae bacterium]|nr:glycosyltransferase family 2 protein [Oscillospiraceae bacterium]